MPNIAKPYQAADTTVMILAAGEGRRMLPLTKETPKPLLTIGEHSLLEHHLIKLQSLGFKNIVINIAYLGEKIKQTIKDGSQFNLNISYSDETTSGALETAGGIANALPLINSDPFLVVNADIWTDFDFACLLEPLEQSGRLVLVNNPAHNVSGDFSTGDNNDLCLKKPDNGKSYTFSGIALYKKSIFQGLSLDKQALAPILHSLSKQRQLSSYLHQGVWADIGTPDRLKEMNKTIRC